MSNGSENPLVSVLVFLYALPALIFTLYYNYQYARDNGFLAWLFFGEIVATFKGILWPVFVFLT